MSRQDVSEYDDTIDSRDVIERIEELEAMEKGEDIGDETYAPDLSTWMSDEEVQELADLRALAKQGEGFDDWHHGLTLIRENYFAEYQKDVATDCYHDSIGQLPDWVVIDWEETADNLIADYSDVTFRGVTYWAR